MDSFNFDTSVNIQENNFVKRNLEFLQENFGSKELEPFFIADMDFKVAPAISSAMIEIAQRGVFSYEFPPQNLYTVMTEWYQRRHQLTLNPERFEVVHGVLSAIALLIQEFSNEGDNVMIQTPVYHQFANCIQMNKRIVTNNSLKLQKDNSYTFDIEQLEDKIKKEKPKILILCNPHNPVGRVWKKDELEKVVNCCRKYGIYIISDEVHCDIIFNGNTFQSLAQFDYDRIICLLGSTAKTFGMQGASAGFIYTNNQTLQIKIKKKIETMYLNHVPSILLYGVRASYLGGEKWLNALINYLNKSREWIINYITNSMSEIRVTHSEGTYQLWLDFRATGMNKNELDDFLFQKTKVGLAPGHWFGKEGEGFARINYATPLANTVSAMEKLNQYLIERNK